MADSIAHYPASGGGAGSGSNVTSVTYNTGTEILTVDTDQPASFNTSIPAGGASPVTEVVIGTGVGRGSDSRFTFDPTGNFNLTSPGQIDIENIGSGLPVNISADDQLNLRSATSVRLITDPFNNTIVLDDSGSIAITSTNLQDITITSVKDFAVSAVATTRIFSGTTQIKSQGANNLLLQTEQDALLINTLNSANFWVKDTGNLEANPGAGGSFKFGHLLGATTRMLTVDVSGVVGTSAIPGGTIGGSIADTQIAFGTGPNSIAGLSTFTYDYNNEVLNFNTTSYPLGLLDIKETGVSILGDGQGAVNATYLVIDDASGDTYAQANTFQFILKNENTNDFRITSSADGGDVLRTDGNLKYFLIAPDIGSYNVGIGPAAVAPLLSKLTVGGSFATPSPTPDVSTTYTFTDLDHTKTFDTSLNGANTVVTIPDATSCPGREYYIKVTNGTFGADISPTVGFIEGSATYSILSGEGVIIQSDGTDWWVIADKNNVAAGISSLNGLTGATQTFATPGTTGTAPAWVSSGTAHTLNIPLASATSVTAGLLSKANFDIFNAKESALTFSTGLTRATNTITSNLSTGVSGGQTAIGGTASGNNLTLSSTSNATKGKIILGSASAYDEVNDRLGIGLTSPITALDVLGVSLSGSAATGAVNIAQTWNTTGAPTAIKLNVTNTAAGAALLMDLQASAVSQFKVDKAGVVTTNGAMTVGGTISTSFSINGFNGVFTGLLRAAAASTIEWNGRTKMSSPSDGVMLLTNNAATDFTRLQFGGTTSSFPAIKRNTTALNFRLADDSADANITAGSAIFSGPIRLQSYTVATLPAGTQGDRAYVTDALAPAFLVAVAGGGAVVTPVFRNATTWVCG